MGGMNMNKVYEIINEKMIKKIEDAIVNGCNPWRMPWTRKRPRNYVTGRFYNGINLWLLEGSEFVTWTQICDLQKKNPEVKLKKGCRKQMVVFFKFNEFETTDKSTGEIETKTIPLLRYYTVYSIDDVYGLESNYETFENEPIETAEVALQYYMSEAGVGFDEVEGGNKAYYSPKGHYIRIPAKNQFRDITEYYSTLAHECVHSTGKILGRFDDKVSSHTFASDSYSREELCAELGANLIMSMLGIQTEKAENNNIAYLRSWLKQLKDDTTLLVSASNKATKAVDLILKTYDVVDVEEVA